MNDSVHDLWHWNRQISEYIALLLSEPSTPLPPPTIGNQEFVSSHSVSIPIHHGLICMGNVCICCNKSSEWYVVQNTLLRNYGFVIITLILFLTPPLICFYCSNWVLSRPSFTKNTCRLSSENWEKVSIPKMKMSSSSNGHIKKNRIR